MKTNLLITAVVALLGIWLLHQVPQQLLILGVPFALVGSIWYLALLGYIAVWVGLIALAGVAAKTSAVMLSYLDEACRRRRAHAGRLHSLQDLLEAVAEGAMERIRPVSMTSLANIIGLLPVMWASGVGADVMKRLAAPMVGGVFSAMLLTLIVIPLLYTLIRTRFKTG
jgi:Cu(I)/Ag(I) efflux system membrane protein CusA/SilA